MYLRILIALLTSLFFTINAQSLKLDWANSYGGPHQDGVEGLTTDMCENVLATGYFRGSVNFGTTNTPILLTAPAGSGFFQQLDPGGNPVNAFDLGGGIAYDVATEIIVDASGNRYFAGYFTGTVDFQPGPGSFTLSSAQNSVPSRYICAYGPDLKLLWVRSVGLIVANSTYHINLDKDGNVYLLSAFQGTMDIDPGPGTTIITSAPNNNAVFVLKLDKNGNYLNSFVLNGTALQRPRQITFDHGNNLLILCEFLNGTIDADPGPSQNLFTAGIIPEALLIKLSNTGTLIWARQIGPVRAWEFTIDGLDNIYWSGYWDGTADLDPGPAVLSFVSVNSDAFMIKLSSAGNLVWVKVWGGSGEQTASACVYIDNQIIVSGWFDNTTDFDPSPAAYNLSPLGLHDGYILRLDPDGNFINVMSVGGTGKVYIEELALTPSGQLITAGRFDGSADFDPSPNTKLLSSAGNWDVFVAKYLFCEEAPQQVCNNVPLCSGNSATLQALSNGNISWYSSLSSTITIGTGSAFVTPVLAAGVYTYFASSSACSVSASRSSFVVNINPTPTLVVAPTQLSLCPGSKVTLVALGAQSYTWNNSVNGSSFMVVADSSKLLMLNGRDTLSGCSANRTYSVYVSPCVSVDEYSADQLKIYPNPVTNTFFIELEEEQTIVITDISGRTVLQQQGQKGKRALDVSALNPGVYFVRLVNTQKPDVQKKIIVVR